MNIIETIELSKTYRVQHKGIFTKTFIALDRLNLQVAQGSILGFLGPNGSGKTTTFKLLLNLIRPTSGTMKLFGNPATDHTWRKHVGFLPENPYFYPYLTTNESLKLYGVLSEVPSAELEKRIDTLLTQVGLDHVKDKQIKKFSRGMMQRLGIAQALIHNPQLLILDEPMSGLDPMGRKEMRDIIIDCKNKGKTVIFSSHILSDVEMICDNVAILRKGQLQYTGDLHTISNQGTKSWEVIFAKTNSPLIAKLSKDHNVTRLNATILMQFDNERQARDTIVQIENEGGQLISFSPRRSSLEELFITTAKENI